MENCSQMTEFKRLAFNMSACVGFPLAEVLPTQRRISARSQQQSPGLQTHHFNSSTAGKLPFKAA